MCTLRVDRGIKKEREQKLLTFTHGTDRWEMLGVGLWIFRSLLQQLTS